jgi:hypothetical protein
MDTRKDLPAPSGGLMTLLLFIAGGLCILFTSITGFNDNEPGIVSLIVGCCAVFLGAVSLTGAWRGRRPLELFLYWTPRALCIVFAAFISLFAMDVFSENSGFLETSLALLLHLIPTFVIIGVLVISWRREWIGGILFIAMGLLYVIAMWGRFPLSTYLIIAGAPGLMGILFLLNWRQRVSARAAAHA